MSRIIVMLPNNLGDVIMTLPLLDALKTADPSRHVSFLVEKGYAGGLENSPVCDRIITIDRRRMKEMFCSDDWKEGITALRSLAHDLSGEGEAVVVNLSQHPYLSYLVSAVVASDIRGRRYLREGNHALSDPWSQYLYTIPFARDYNGLHASDVYCRIADVRAGKDKRWIIPTEREYTACGAFFTERNFPIDRPLIVFQPGAAWPSKRWPAGAFISLGKMLLRDGYRIVITGAPEERDTALRIAGELGERCCATAGDLSFRESIVTLTMADAVVTGDTAIMHAAAAVGTRVIALFGPTSPVETGPYGSGHTVLCGTCPHRPCFTPTCASGSCLAAITPALVYGCIRENPPESGSGVERYTTGFTDGVYRLVPEGGVEGSYVDAGGAALTRMVFEPSFFKATVQPEASEVIESRRFIDQCARMEQLLTKVKAGGGAMELRQYEQTRIRAEHLGGIAAFWSALLNIRLNSVPLLDPIAGIDGSIAACRSTREQITTALEA